MTTTGRREERRGVDWAALQKRVDALVHGNGQEASEQSVLRERARRLAVARPVSSMDVDDQRKWIAFQIGEERFALDARYLTEVMRQPRLTRVPLAPPQLRGLVNYRGAILPVFELTRLLGRASAESGEHPLLLVLGQDEAEFAVGASSVADLINFEMLRDAGAEAHRTGLVARVTPDAITLIAADLLLRDPNTFIGGLESTLATKESG